MRKCLRIEVVLVLVGLAGCEPSAPVTVTVIAPEFAAVVRTVAEPAGSHCASGGRAVETGLDRNRNGALDDAEVTATSYVCDAPTRVLLLRAAAEPAGSHCAIAGMAVNAGLDVNADGVLEDEEVDRVQYQCGVEAPKAAEVLTRSTVETAGSHCASGGTRIDAGPDRDANGVLDASEVAQSLWVCAPKPGGPVLVRKASAPVPGCRGDGFLVSAGADDDGDGVLADLEVEATAGVCSSVVLSYLVATQADLDYLANNVWLVLGDLKVALSTLSTVHLPHNLGVAGSIRVEDNQKLTDLSMQPAVLGGDVVIARNPALSSVSVGLGLGSDSKMAGSITIEDAPKLETLYTTVSALGGSLTLRRTGLKLFWLNSVLHVDGSIIIDDNDALTSASLSLFEFGGVMTIGGDLSIINNGKLTEVSAAELRRVEGNLVLSHNDAMKVLSSGWLGYRSPPSYLGELTVGGSVVISDNASLVGAELMVRTVGGFEVTNNPALATIFCYSLKNLLGDFTVTDNAALWALGSWPTHLAVVTGSIHVARNPQLLSTSALSGLIMVGGELSIADAPLLENFGAVQLVSAGRITIQDTGLRWLGVAPPERYFDNLTALSNVRDVTLLRNPRLADLHLPSLTHLASLSVVDNPLLPTCQAQALARQTGVEATLSGNDPAASCP